MLVTSSWPHSRYLWHTEGTATVVHTRQGGSEKDSVTGKAGGSLRSEKCSVSQTREATRNMQTAASRFSNAPKFLRLSGVEEELFVLRRQER